MYFLSSELEPYYRHCMYYTKGAIPFHTFQVIMLFEVANRIGKQEGNFGKKGDNSLGWCKVKKVQFK